MRITEMNRSKKGIGSILKVCDLIGLTAIRRIEVDEYQ
jgi:hypothetical protein